MLVLGIETSCDETAAAVLEDGTSLRSNVIASQDEIHSKFGGIVPELAGRCHVERIDLIIQQALDDAGVDLLISPQMKPGNHSPLLHREPGLLNVIGDRLRGGQLDLILGPDGAVGKHVHHDPPGGILGHLRILCGRRIHPLVDLNENKMRTDHEENKQEKDQVNHRRHVH